MRTDPERDEFGEPLRSVKGDVVVQQRGRELEERQRRRRRLRERGRVTVRQNLALKLERKGRERLEVDRVCGHVGGRAKCVVVG